MHLIKQFPYHLHYYFDEKSGSSPLISTINGEEPDFSNKFLFYSHKKS
jgi:hypothetical protein